MTDRISGNPHDSTPAGGSRGLPSLAAPAPAPSAPPPPASDPAKGSAGWSPTAWKAGARR